MEYRHRPLGEEVQFLCGSYWVEREELLPYKGEDVLYLVGRTSSITACCGGCSPFSFIKVVGRVKCWHCDRDYEGNPISDIEPIRDPEEQREIRELLHRQFREINPFHIEFW